MNGVKFLKLLTILAYIIVIVASQLTLLVGAVFAMLISLLFSWLPKNLINKVGPLIGGLFGPLISLGISWLVFQWLTKDGTWGIGALLAALVPLWIPITNDFRKAKELERIKAEAPIYTKRFAERNFGSLMYLFYGEVLGVMCSVFVFCYVKFIVGTSGNLNL